MISISQVSKHIGVARSTLLYYERIGILIPTRNPENGYREYSQKDVETLLLVRQLQLAGLSLKESIDIMHGNLDPTLIKKRYQSIENKIKNMMMAKQVLKSLLEKATGESVPRNDNERSGRNWHAEFERKGAEAHSSWLQKLGFDEKESTYIRWVTRDIADNTEYMSHFFKVFECMKRQGPGSSDATLKVFEIASSQREIKTILEIGCGKGESCLLLAENTDARITAVDNHQPFLDYLEEQITISNYQKQISTVNMSMFELDFPQPCFDLIWSEGSAYFMGFEKALKQWKALINSQGFLFISDAVWLTEQPSPACVDYWKIEYPNMTDIATRKEQASQQGYEITSCFVLPQQAWTDFFLDMAACIKSAVKECGMIQAFEDMLKEIEIDKQYGGEYGYLCMLLRRQD
jgi:DNA-binding transcriptional MerR regulator/SAM-dependent methyltransferase